MTHPDRNFLRFSAFALAGAAFVSGIASAENTDLDPTYGFGGGFLRVIGPVADRANGAALQPDGKLVMAGLSKDANSADQFGLIRHRGDGSPDTGYGDGTGTGKVLLNLLAGYDTAVDVAHTAAGTYVAGNSCANGTGQCSMSLVRLTPLGTLDTGFGNGGLFTISYDTYAMTRAMAVQRDGKIVLVGSSWTTNNEHNTVVVRINANGTLDSSFGLMGAVRINLSYAQTDVATDVAVGDDGRIIVAGYTYHQGNHKNFVLALNAYGDYDRGFRNGDMLYFTQTGYHYYDPNVAIDPDGRILITSQALRMQPYTWGMNISRILPNGTIDTAYGVNGYRFTTLGSGGIYTTSGIELLPTGEAMVAGTLSAGTSTNGSSKPFMARFTTSGALDPLFAGGVGYKNGDISSNSAYGTAGRFLNVAPDGKLYLGGYSEDMFYVLRYLGDPLDVAPAPVYFPERNQVPRATLQTSDVVTVSGLTAGARVPITVSGGSYIRNNGAATTQPGYVTNGDTLRLVHTAASGYSSQVTTTVTFGGLSPANNRGTVLGAATTASFTTITEADTGGNTPPGGGEES